MRITRFVLPLVLAAAALPGCRPRPVAQPVPEAPPPPPGPTAEELEREREAQAQALWREGTDLGRRGRWAEAEARHREAARLRPLSPTYHLALAAALQNQGKAWEAADALWAGIRAEEALPAPNHRVLAVDYERLIELLERTNRLDEARQARERQAHHRRMRDQ